ncbi:hypothetical protein ISCGN_032634 [Ixodes scapularis]
MMGLDRSGFCGGFGRVLGKESGMWTVLGSRHDGCVWRETCLQVFSPDVFSGIFAAVPAKKRHPVLVTTGTPAGFVRTDREDYLVEPLAPAQGHGPQPHLVYKRSALLDNPPGGPIGEDHFCATQGMAPHPSVVPDAPSGGSPRVKRSVSLERNVETLLVADRTMVEYYSNEDLQTYLLTVLNMVSTLFHDASIGNAINVVLVRMILLEPEAAQEGQVPPAEDLDQLQVDESADGTLKSFCRWQRFVNPSDESHPNHHDLAILVTRFNMCAPGLELCSTLGLAEVAGMCQPQRSCNVNQDSGLTLAYTIAHEMGHK